MAKATTKKTASSAKSASLKGKSISKKVSPKAAQPTPRVRVKKGGDVLATVNTFIAYNVHDRYSFRLSKKVQTQLVAYGPWLAALLVTVISPQLLNLAKNGNLMTISGFFNEIFFNQQAWVVLIIILLSTLLVVDGLSDLFSKKLRGWNRVYVASLATAFYTTWQLAGNLNQPAAALLSTLGAFFVIFCLLDIRNYYS